MPDTFDSYQADPSSVPPLTRAILDAMPTTLSGETVGPVLSDKAFRKLLDALASIETP